MVFACTEGPEEITEAKSEIIIGLNPSERSENTQQNADLLADLISQRMKMPVKMFVAQDYSGLVEALRARTIDFAFLAPVSYVHAERIANAEVLLKAERNGSPYYYGCIVVHAESPYKTIDDLIGKEVAWVDPSSASGHIFPKASLIEAGYQPDSIFSKEVFAGGHDAVLLAIINKTLDAGATYANDTLGESGSWTQLENGSLQHQVRPIFFSQPIPGDNIATSRYMIEKYPELVKQVKETISTMHLDPEGAKVIKEMYHVDAMVPATSADYDPVRKAAELLHLDITGKIAKDDPEQAERNRRNSLYSWLFVIGSVAFGVLLIVQTKRQQGKTDASQGTKHREEINKGDSSSADGAQFSLREIAVTFEDRDGRLIPALNGVTLNIVPGEFLAIIGPSGAGKSTLLRLLNHALESTGGRIWFDGNETTRVQGRELRRLRRRIGFIFQQFNLVTSLSVLHNVLTGRLSSTPTGQSLFGLFSSEDVQHAEAVLKEVGLGDKIRSRTSDLSGGQQQRVAIARALAQEPEALLADEPTASLDPILAESILTLLQTIHRDRGITIVANLHSIDLAQRYATRIIGLRSGQIVFDDTPDRLTEEKIGMIYHETVETEHN